MCSRLDGTNHKTISVEEDPDEMKQLDEALENMNMDASSTAALATGGTSQTQPWVMNNDVGAVQHVAAMQNHRSSGLRSLEFGPE
ncbi:hypothetical protein AgCh_015321 [Apium graveolens]